MPARVLIIGAIFCLAGVLAIWSVIVAALVESRLNINLAAFMLPVGIGLFKGRPSSRAWAGFWIVLGYLGCLLMAGLTVAAPQSVSGSWFERELHGAEAASYALLAAATMLVVLIAVHKLLYSEKASAYFSRDRDSGQAMPSNPSPSNR